ncbi:hypothetical protein F0562_026366 [Nyssa sinensis]|uniref:NB-ARC domain-containing protein n=1 Tax=Nyssa sinensis TaxID=561372 RepID=A0A5J5BAJ3_9ASTE|nr:hypothetical protein F0562_026366 [Nyssa sinensis]
MQCFLKDADQRQEQDERVRNWVAEIRNVAYDAEDVIESFIFKVGRRGGGLWGSLRRSTFIVGKAYSVYRIGSEIKSIRINLGDISNSLQTYSIKFASNGEGTSSMSEMQRRFRRSYPHVEEDDVISLEASTRAMMAELMKKEERLRVVSIVGMGGFGKTTLAKKIYNHDNVKRHFECHAWTFISQQYATRDVLLGILTKVFSPSPNKRQVLEKLKEEELVEKLYNFLRGKRYLMVLDDIWSNEAWDSLKVSFPNGKMGSKILLTTRNKEVALHADPWSSPIEPPFLNDEESWDLFCRKAFPRDIVGDQGCPPELVNLGKKMMKKCGGLPLALVVLGGLLATKNSLNEWQAVQRNINAHLNKFESQHYGGVYGILSLSHHELPYYLKPCFLYLGHFPEDWEIKKKKLIRLWIAEGFISPLWQGEREETVEDVAEQCLEELINRCMVQLVRRDSTGRGVKTCRIHDLMWDPCVSMAREESFLGIIRHQGHAMADDDSSSLRLATTKSRRLAIHASSRSDLKRVLDLEGALFDNAKTEVPKAIGKLIHLRYLGLRKMGTATLPRSIGKLRRLQTLDLRDNYSLKTLPDVIWKMECLRHLFFSNWNENIGVRLDTLRNLETLKYAYAADLLRNDGVRNLTNLQNLGIKFERSSEVEEVLGSPIIRQDRFQSLYMLLDFRTPEILFPSLEVLSRCHHLVKLWLNGRIPEDVHSHRHHLEFLPPNVTYLILFNTRLEQDPMAMLEKLPNLRILK